jgi:16S rRNA (guanine527-N7)-methyltransferase
MSILYEGAREFGLELTPVQLEAFETYYHLLVEWNARINLTAITGYTEVQIFHFLDSLSVGRALPKYELDGKQLIDVGAGAGFPGVPLAIAFPHLQVALLEATGKKAVFLDGLARELGLDNVTTIKGRAEEVAHLREQREQYDFAVARAVAELRTLVEFTLPFVRVGGRFIAQKTTAAAEETKAAGHALQLLGGAARELIPIQLPSQRETRHLVVIAKVAHTPDKYPRRAGVPSKKPL